MPLVEEDRPGLGQPRAQRPPAPAPEVPWPFEDERLELDELAEADDPIREEEITADEPSTATPSDETSPSVATVAAPPAKISRVHLRSSTPPVVHSVDASAWAGVTAPRPPETSDSPASDTAARLDATTPVQEEVDESASTSAEPVEADAQAVEAEVDENTASADVDTPEPVKAYVEILKPVEADIAVVKADTPPIKSEVPVPVDVAPKDQGRASCPPAPRQEEAKIPPLPPSTPVEKLRQSLPALSRPVSSAPAPVEAAAPTLTTPPVQAEDESPKKEPSFFMQQESVFDAHELGLCTLSEVMRNPGQFKPERHYRMKASRRRAVAAAIQKFGLDVARLAARNLPMTVHLPDDGEMDGLHPLDIERAFRDPARIVRFCRGADDLLADAFRARRQAFFDHADLIRQEPSPWQPPAEEVPNSQEEVPNPQGLF